MEVFDDALLVVDDTLPYRTADATLRKLLNQARHEVIASYRAEAADAPRVDRGTSQPF
jgi:hypothetical protein